MIPIIFVKTRYHYESYTDFWRLVELSGFPFVYVDEVDVKNDAVYILSPHNGEWDPHIDNHRGERRAHLIHWNLERPGGSGGVGNYVRRCRELVYERYFDEIWISDRKLAEEAWQHFIVLGSHPDLGEPCDDKQYDYCHMSYVTPRREHVYNRVNASVGPNCWPPERHDVLRKSRFALNVHQDQYPFQEPLRLALFAAYGLPVLTENIRDSYPWGTEYCEYASFDDMSNRLRQMLGEDYGRWRDMGLRARERMCNEFRFDKCVRESVNRLGIS